MKHLFGIPVMLAIVVTLAACSGSDTAETNREIAASVTNKNATSSQDYYARSVELARANGCWDCHHVDKDLIGPSWRSVSKHYKNDPNAREWLVSKVEKGGSGVWSQVTSGAVMPPNSPRVSDQNVRELVDFILWLEKGGPPAGSRTEATK